MAETAKDLIQISRARRALAEARTVSDGLEIRDQAAAVYHYLKRRDGAEQAAREALDIRLRAERFVGERLQNDPAIQRGGSKSRGVTLPDGVSKMQSHRWQYIALLPDNVFEEELRKPEPSTARLVMLARRIERSQRNAALAENAPEIGERVVPSPVLYVDPPWRYDYTRAESRAIENQYPTMTLDEICALEVPVLPDAVLFLWATSPKLEDALSVITAWGFHYRTCMVWVKDKIGMGYYARQQHELLLIASKGKLPTPEPETRPSSVQKAPREKHSQKPEIFYELIEKMYPHFRDLWCEGFARQKREHWQRWGYEA